ncbi:arsenate reductase/protein-tyrosine-phosphatase family protein [Microbacterium gorillae]|uniref:arsenate reductase/protein-tyrosine-phosphatase family protein n=1 Tax=Microbacterium gorillae TaxID=1231063 RepID=UPI00059041CD|nr:hypothetical protein [Microbacterium gorillae]
MAFVCAANVCRSPVMEVAFRQTVRDATAWDIVSAGTQVTRADRMCAVAARHVGTTAVGATFAAGHRSRAATPDLLRSRDIVLGATVAERRRLAVLVPALRERTFTVREAVLLGAEEATIDEIAAARAVHGADLSGLALYAAVLDARRGVVPMPEPSRGILPWRAGPDPRDITDRHTSRLARHHGAIRLAESSAQEFAQQAQRFLDMPGNRRGRRPSHA